MVVGIDGNAIEALQHDTINHEIALRQRDDLLVDFDEADLSQRQPRPIAQVIVADRKVVGVTGIENGGKRRRTLTANGQRPRSETDAKGLVPWVSLLFPADQR